MKKGRVNKILLTAVALCGASILLSACELSRLWKDPSEFHKHTYSEEWTYDATDHWHAATCEHTEATTTRTPHDWDDGKVLYEPTCGEEGLVRYTCKTCGAVSEVETDKLEHPFLTIWSHDEAYHWHAADCEHDVTANLGAHDWSLPRVIEEPTCAHTGSTEQECLVCGMVRTQEVPALTEHPASDEWSSNLEQHWHTPTCIHEDAKPDAAEHTWGAAKVITRPTCMIEGFNEYTCLICGYVKAESVPIISTHTYESEWSSDDMFHWHAAECIHADEVSARGVHNWDVEHIVEDGNQGQVYEHVCKTCGKVENFSVGLVFTKNDRTHNYSVSAGTASGEVFIPNVYQGELVTEIAEEGFKNNTRITRISLPVSIGKIGARAFYGCSALEGVQCNGQSCVVGESAFADCPALSDVAFLDANEIGANAFENCEALTSVSVFGSVYYIGDHAFENCKSVERFTLGEGLQEVGEYAFKDCSAFYTFSVPVSTRSLGRGAFEGCTGLTVIVIPSGIKTLSEDLFRDCSSLSDLIIPATVTRIEVNAFRGCYNALHESDGVQYASGWAIDSAPAATEAILAGDTVGIAESAFAESGIESVVLNENLKYIGEYAFANARQLKTVTFGGNVEEIGKAAFEGCLNLESVILPDTVKKLNDNAFRGCEKLSYVVLGTRITSISQNAFENCYAFNKVFFKGSPNDWRRLGTANHEGISSATVYYYSESPIAGGTHWHYENGVPTVW